MQLAEKSAQLKWGKYLKISG